jgi:hypothetical protein
LFSPKGYNAFLVFNTGLMAKQKMTFATGTDYNSILFSEELTGGKITQTVHLNKALSFPTWKQGK